ncbi:hypothetical protein N8773_00875 [Candidatus Pseudothioglobus singularis]|nr:hypothetical protein [Candidatus Pseudothioglobus singularis]
MNGSEWRNEKELWGAWHKKNSRSRHVKECFNITYQSNDIGARDTENYLTIDNNDNVVVIGDSFVEGLGVPMEDTFSFRLKDEYGKKGLNFGASGNSGPLQQYLLYKNLASTIPHNEVVYLFLPSNDFEDNDGRHSIYGNRYRPYFTGNEYKITYPNGAVPSNFFPSGLNHSRYIRAIKRFILGYTWTANSIRTVRSVLSENKIIKGITESQIPTWEGHYTKDQYAVDGTMFYINKLFSEIPNNYKKTIIVIPDYRDLKKINSGLPYKNLNWYTQLQKIASQFNSKFIDLAEVAEYRHDVFLTCDGHWSARGNSIVLEEFKKYRFEEN